MDGSIMSLKRPGEALQPHTDDHRLTTLCDYFEAAVVPTRAEHEAEMVKFLANIPAKDRERASTFPIAYLSRAMNLQRIANMAARCVLRPDSKLGCEPSLEEILAEIGPIPTRVVLRREATIALAGLVAVGSPMHSAKEAPDLGPMRDETIARQLLARCSSDPDLAAIERSCRTHAAHILRERAYPIALLVEVAAKVKASPPRDVVAAYLAEFPAASVGRARR